MQQDPSKFQDLEIQVWGCENTLTMEEGDTELKIGSLIPGLENEHLDSPSRLHPVF